MWNVKSGRTIAERLEYYSHDDPETGCRVWDTCKHNRYGSLGLKVNGKTKMVRAHRLVWEAANGPVPEGRYVLHNCPHGDNPKCIRLEHLWLGTHQDNMDDMYAKGRGRKLRGEETANAVLDEAQVRAIRVAIGTQRSIAEAFGVSQSTVWAIKARRLWKHLK